MTYANMIEEALRKQYPRLSKKNLAELMKLAENYWCPDPDGPDGNLSRGLVDTNIALLLEKHPKLFKPVPTSTEALATRDTEHREKFGEPMPPGEKRLLARQLAEAEDSDAALLACVPADWQPAAEAVPETREAELSRFDGPGDPRFESEVTRRWGIPPHQLSARKRDELYRALTSVDPRPAADRRELTVAATKAQTRTLSPSERRSEFRARQRLATGGR